jgi:hypothetical protein
MSVILYPARKAMAQTTISVQLTGMRAWRVRAWIGLRVLRLGVAIMGCKVAIDIDGSA